MFIKYLTFNESPGWRSVVHDLIFLAAAIWPFNPAGVSSCCPAPGLVGRGLLGAVNPPLFA